MDSVQPVDSNQPKLITLNIVGTKEELDILGKGLTEVCDRNGLKFEKQGTDLSPNGNPIYRIVKVQVLGGKQNS